MTWDRDRCEACSGEGLIGGWLDWPGGPLRWRVGLCQVCRGRGWVEPVLEVDRDGNEYVHPGAM